MEGAKERYCDSFLRRILWCSICAFLSPKLASQAFGNQDQCRNWKFLSHVSTFRGDSDASDEKAQNSWGVCFCLCLCRLWIEAADFSWKYRSNLNIFKRKQPFLQIHRASETLEEESRSCLGQGDKSCTALSRCGVSVSKLRTHTHAFSRLRLSLLLLSPEKVGCNQRRKKISKQWAPQRVYLNQKQELSNYSVNPEWLVHTQKCFRFR